MSRFTRFSSLVLVLFSLLGVSCGVGDDVGFQSSDDTTADDDVISDDDTTPVDISGQISEELLNDPEACPPDSTLLAVRREADGIYYLYGVVDGQVWLAEPLGSKPSLTLGETDQEELASHGGNVIQAQPLDYANLQVCITRFFETGEGQPWPGGMNILDAQSVRGDLLSWGFDLPNLKVSLLATAGPFNQRFLYGDQRDTSLCEQDDIHPQHPIGYYEGCESVFGLRDQGSYWTMVGEEFAGYIPDAVVASDGLRFGVAAGPNARIDTFYAATNYGIHFHTEMDLYRYEDDRLGYITSTPGDWQPGWEDLLQFREDFTSWAEQYPENTT